MATYKGIQGFTIQNLSADPSNPIEGQVWYNSTSNVWKVEEATTVGAWASGTNLLALGFGGYVGPVYLHQRQKNMNGIYLDTILTI
jgi:hypothetical protein